MRDPRTTLRVWSVLIALGLLIVFALREWIWRGDVLAIVAGTGLILRVLYLLDEIRSEVKDIKERLS